MEVTLDRRSVVVTVGNDRRVTSPMPERYARITGPARAYLAVMTLRFGVLGAVALCGSPPLVAGPAMNEPVSIEVWGVAFTAMALASTIGVVLGRERLFRALILVSFFLTAATAARLGVGLAEGDLRFVLAPVFAATLALKDMVVSAMQVTAPMRDLLPEVSGDG